jgi:hypothetical protein
LPSDSRSGFRDSRRLGVAHDATKQARPAPRSPDVVIRSIPVLGRVQVERLLVIPHLHTPRDARNAPALHRLLPRSLDHRLQRRKHIMPLPHRILPARDHS